MNTLENLQPLNAPNVISNPIMRYLKPCPESHQRVIQHYQKQNMVESLPKTRLFRLNEAPAKPPFLEKILQLLRSHGFNEQRFRIGFAGYGNVKAYLAEIGLASTTPGFYNLHLGGNVLGNQLNTVYKINASETEILQELNNRLLPAYKLFRKPNETFGDFVSRKKFI